LLLLVVVAAGCSRAEDVPDLERQAQAINREVMCPVCPGESIDQSQNPVAVQMRGIVMDRLQDGWTAAQIKAYFVDSYEPRVLMEPPRSGFNLVAWLVPPIAFAGALAALTVVLRFLRGRRPTEPEPVAELSPAERADYFARIEAAVDGSGPTVASPSAEAEGGS
jgi:cytochrome c-type biogenesis protein CcmH